MFPRSITQDEYDKELDVVYDSFLINVSEELDRFLRFITHSGDQKPIEAIRKFARVLFTACDVRYFLDASWRGNCTQSKYQIEPVYGWYQNSQFVICSAGDLPKNWNSFLSANSDLYFPDGVSIAVHAKDARKFDINASFDARAQRAFSNTWKKTYSDLLRYYIAGIVFCQSRDRLSAVCNSITAKIPDQILMEILQVEPSDFAELSDHSKSNAVQSEIESLIAHLHQHCIAPAEEMYVRRPNHLHQVQPCGRFLSVIQGIDARAAKYLESCIIRE